MDICEIRVIRGEKSGRTPPPVVAKADCGTATWRAGLNRGT
jgi:hypothetical protein